MTNASKSDLARKVTLYSVIALIALYAAAEFSSERVNWTLLLVSCASLAMFLPGIIRRIPRAYDWLCFLVLMHFIKGTTDAMMTTATWQDYMQVFLTTLIFLSAMMTSRWIKSERTTPPIQET